MALRKYNRTCYIFRITYSLSRRQAAISFIEGGGSKVEASRILKVSRDTLYRWLELNDLSPKPRPKSFHRKIDKAAQTQSDQQSQGADATG
ncbi:MAG: IS630 transposase-related protein, partial [Bdellovibrionales bacterium]